MTNSLKIDRDSLASRLKAAISFVPKTEIIPMFSNFFCTIESNMMQIIASGPNMQIRLFCPVESKTNWAFCVPATLFLSTVNNYQENIITITEKSKVKIEVKCGKSKAGISLDCQPENFTPMRIDNINSEIFMHQSMLKKAMGTVKEFINPEHPNENFQVMNITEINNKIIFTGLINALMCRAAVRPISISSWKPVSIPTDTVKNLLSALDTKGEIGITHSDSKICFRISGAPADTVEVISVIHNGAFPDTEKLFNACPPDYITINTAALKNCLKRLKLYADKDTPIFTIENKGNSQELQLKASDENIGRELEESLEITNSQQLIIDKCYNITLFLDVLSSIESAEVRLQFNDYHNSFVLPVVNSEEENVFNCLICETKKNPVVNGNNI